MAKNIAGPVGELYVDDGGSAGVPLIFVNSFANDSQHWRSQLAHLRPRRRALVIDLHGHGQSEGAFDAAIRPADLARDIAAVADALELRRFVLVGHGVGGAAAAAYVAQWPQRVSGIVLAGTFEPMPGLRHYQGPSLIIESDHDVGPSAWYHQMPDVARKQITGTSAWPQMDKPQEFNRLLDEFLAWVA